jgi:hypothetical protein
MIPLDHKIKSAIATWRKKGYEQSSAVTQRLLEGSYRQSRSRSSLIPSESIASHAAAI